MWKTQNFCSKIKKIRDLLEEREGEREIYKEEAIHEEKKKKAPQNK